MTFRQRTREAFNKIFNMFYWENRPSTATSLGQTNLNKLNIAINTLDDRVVQLDAEKLDLDIANLMVSKFEMDMNTGIIKVTQLNGTVQTYDLALEKIPTSFSMTEDGVITMTNADGTTYTADIGNLIRQFTFNNSDTIGFTTENLSDGSKRIQASVIAGSLDESHFKATFAQEIRENTQAAVQSANSASESAKLSERYATGRDDMPESAEDNAKYYATQSKRYAVGDESVAGSDKDNAKHYYEQTKAISESAASQGNVTFASYQALISAVNAADNTIYKTANQMLVKSDGVPDLWVSEILSSSMQYQYTTDDEIISKLRTDGSIVVGYYRLSPMEAKTNMATTEKAGIVKASDQVSVGADGEMEIGYLLDTLGIAGDANSQQKVQTLIDAISNKVMNELLPKAMMSNVHINSETHVPTSSLAYSMNEQISKLNEESYRGSYIPHLLSGGEELSLDSHKVEYTVSNGICYLSVALWGSIKNPNNDQLSLSIPFQPSSPRNYGLVGYHKSKIAYMYVVCTSDLQGISFAYATGTGEGAVKGIDMTDMTVQFSITFSIR